MDVVNIQDIKDEDTRKINDSLLNLINHLKEKIDKNDLKSLIIIGCTNNHEMIKGRAGMWFSDLYSHVGMLESTKAWLLEEEDEANT